MAGLCKFLGGGRNSGREWSSEEPELDDARSTFGHFAPAVESAFHFDPNHALGGGRNKNRSGRYNLVLGVYGVYWALV